MPKKSLGQNYLIDHNIAKKIIKKINFNKNYNIIEVGPGKGFLTNYLIKEKHKNLFLIEKDNRLFLNLIEKYKNRKNIKIYNKDILKTEILYNIQSPKIIVSNLPYNISVKVITNYLEDINNYKGYYFMIQKEVAEKFVYKEKNKSNRLNLFTFLMSNYKIEFQVSPNVFYPKPRVNSCFVSFIPNVKIDIDVNKFKDFTRILFSTKRKKIINNLTRNKYFKNKLYLQKTNLDLSKRPEELNFEEIIILYKFLYR